MYHIFIIIIIYYSHLQHIMEWRSSSTELDTAPHKQFYRFTVSNIQALNECDDMTIEKYT